MATKRGTETVPASDVAVVGTNTTDVVAHREQLQQQIATAIAEMKQDDFDAEQQLFDIFESSTIDDILNSSDVIHLQDVIGQNMTVHGAVLQDSKYEQSMLPMYAVMRVTFDGEDGISLVTTGAAQVIAALVAAQAKEFFPFRCSSSSAITAAGNTVVKLTKPV